MARQVWICEECEEFFDTREEADACEVAHVEDREKRYRALEQNLYPDLDSFVTAIKNHIQRGGSALCSSDNPMARIMGYFSEEKAFGVRLVNVRKPCNLPTEIRTLVTTARGRQELIENFSQGNFYGL